MIFASQTDILIN